MPSAATAKLEKQASTEAVDPIRQAIVIIEHKIRNLEKRKRKIESYREEQKNGKDLNSDQLAAVAKYEEVQQTLEFARDLCKQFNGIAVDAAKQLKKQARKEALEKNQQDLAKVKEILVVQDVLQSMGQESVRKDFLAGQNGAALLGEEDLKYLDDLYSEVSPKHGGEDGVPPFEEQVHHSAEHLLSIVEGKSKEIVGTTYAKLKELCATISTCGYFDRVVEVTGEEQAEVLANAEAGLQNSQEAVDEEDYVGDTQMVSSDATFPQAVPQLQSVTSVSQPPTALPVPSAIVPQPSGSGAPVATPVAAVESSYFSTAAPTFVPAQASALQQSRPLNEVISSVNSSFNFLQESELDSPDLSAMLTGTSQQTQAQQRGVPTPPPSVPVAVAPIPTQTFTNQNFVSVSTANVTQQVVYQTGSELTQSHIPGFATTTPNPPPPIPMPPSHHQHRSVSPAVSVATMQQTYSSQPAAQQVATYASQAQQQPPASVVPNPYSTQQQPQDPVDQQQVTEQMANVAIEDPADSWRQTETSQTDWNQQSESQTDWSQQTETQAEWNSSPGNQTDSFITQTSTRVYGSGRGRMNRGSGRGSSNGYSGNRGRGNYQNGRGGGAYGYRNTEGGNNNYYQNGYQQRDNFGNSSYGGGYKRGNRGGSGGASRGIDRGGPRGGTGGRGGNNPRNRGTGFVRGGGSKQ